MEIPIPLFFILNDMITKKYRANTNISINVVLPSKKNLHISFIPLSDGSSVFITDNKDIQNAIEKNHNYGKLFRLVESYDKANQAAAKPDNEIDSADEVNTVTEIKVSDISAAKDYLADKFGVSRTALRSTQAILNKAEELGITFIGI